MIVIKSKVLIVGDGAREHAIALKLSESPHEPRIYALMAHRNPGIERVSRQSGGWVIIDKLNVDGITRAINEVNPDIVIIGPEEPQFAGVADRALEMGVPTFGVPRRLAMIEQSKAFARELMWKYKIPGRLAFRAFRDVRDAVEYIKNAGSVAIKPARQAGGKGVRVFWENLAYLKDAMGTAKASQVLDAARSASKYGDIEDLIIIEEAVTGVEYTVQVITDGYSVIALPPVQDHPHAFDYDMGPECGGMGSIVGPGPRLPFLLDDEYWESVDIVKRTIEALQREVGGRYVGVLSGQFMLTTYGPTLIEYYSRFGDPEVTNALALLETDLLELVEAAVEGRLSSVKYGFKDGVVAITKAVAPLGYPHNRDLAVNRTVIINEDAITKLGCVVFYGSVEEVNGVYRTLGSRAVEVMALGSTYQETYDRVEECVSQVSSPDWQLFHRVDIGSPELINKRVSEAELVRQVYMWRRSHGLGRVRIDWVPGREPIVYDYS
jgi:phosphoribosylamine--glycine ligase